MYRYLPALCVFIISFLGLSLVSTGQSNLELIKDYLQNQLQEQQMFLSDVEELVITDIVKMNGLEAYQVWVQQHVHGIPVNGAINSYTVTDGTVRSVGNSYAKQIDKESLLTSSMISPSKSIALASAKMGFDMPNGFRAKVQSEEKNKMIFESPDTKSGELEVYREYYKGKEELELIWRVEFSPVIGHDMWSILVEAKSGEIVGEHNYVVKCAFDHNHGALVNKEENCSEDENNNLSASSEESAGQVGNYRVVEFPFESLNFTDRTLVADPNDPEASPFGWHDVNGTEGADFTTLFGNNAFTIIDRDDNGIADTGGESPDGGADLIFDFPFDATAEPVANTDAAMVNAFYANNVMHDFAYHYGFDESINFQETNYTGVNGGSDAVNVRVQAGLNTGEADNATFLTLNDGINPSMRILVGNNGGGSSFRIDAPAEIAGGVNITIFDFSPPITTTAVTGQIVRYLDSSFRPTLGCGSAINSAALEGNVAMIDRGECFFERKALNAENAGAIAVIICNFEPNAPGGIGADTIPNTSIPSVMMGSNDCARIDQVIDQGVTVTFQIIDSDEPRQRDIAFDNGVLAHEYGHGLSMRSIGGPSNSNCLNNEEQQGEGWSDFFLLVVTTMEGQDGTEARGNGSYAFGQSPNGGGIRSFPYSTDPTINPQDMDDLIGNRDADDMIIPHPIGEVWTSALWDMYWNFVNQYGYDVDFIKGSGGNNRAIQLVFDAMKITPCNPGFIDARDAVLLADEVRNEGANACLIWKAFAKRGIGFSSDQGDVNNTNDGTPTFDLPPSCIKELVVQKSVPNNALAGAEMEISSLVINQKEQAVTNVVFTDELPNGGELLSGPNGYSFSMQNNILQVDIGSMAPGDSAMINYVVTSDPSLTSTLTYFDDVEDEDVTDNDWDSEIFEGPNVFIREELDTDAFSGDFYFLAVTTADDSDYALRNFVDHEMSMDFPVLRFHHFYNTEFGFDGGFVEVKEVGSGWRPIPRDKFLRNTYRGELDYSTFSIPNLEAFWGISDGYRDTYIDLSEFKGKTINFRFRYGTDDNSGIDGQWRIDDVAILDLVNANGQACVTSAEGDDNCVQASDIGTVIEGSEVVSVIDIEGESLQIDMHPNPASDIINISFDSPSRRDVWLSIFSIDGKMISQSQLGINPGVNVETLRVDHLAAGMYLAKIRIEGKEVTEKFVVD